MSHHEHVNFQLKDFASSAAGYRGSEHILHAAAGITANQILEVEVQYTTVLALDFMVYDILCSDTNNFLDVKSHKVGNFDPTNPNWPFDTLISYECGIGRAFDFGNGATNYNQEFLCDWQGTWQPQQDLRDCKCKYQMYCVNDA